MLNECKYCPFVYKRCLTYVLMCFGVLTRLYCDVVEVESQNLGGKCTFFLLETVFSVVIWGK